MTSAGSVRCECAAIRWNGRSSSRRASLIISGVTGLQQLQVPHSMKSTTLPTSRVLSSMGGPYQFGPRSMLSTRMGPSAAWVAAGPTIPVSHPMRMHRTNTRVFTDRIPLFRSIHLVPGQNHPGGHGNRAAAPPIPASRRSGLVDAGNHTVKRAPRPTGRRDRLPTATRTGGSRDEGHRSDGSIDVGIGIGVRIAIEVSFWIDMFLPTARPPTTTPTGGVRGEGHTARTGGSAKGRVTSWRNSLATLRTVRCTAMQESAGILWEPSRPQRRCG